jgi:hypothetical protein
VDKGVEHEEKPTVAAHARPGIRAKRRRSEHTIGVLNFCVMAKTTKFLTEMTARPVLRAAG